MTRGIHLKHLTSSDLGLLGLPEAVLPESQPPGKAAHSMLLAEVDPALAKVVRELRLGLQGTLELLEEALAQDQASDPKPLDGGG
jgi:hypothetical protein